MGNHNQVSFTAMDHSTAADWALVSVHDNVIAAGQADRVLGWLEAMDGPSPYRVSRLQHSLQTATRAADDGADDEAIACALLHDIGDELSPLNHSQVAAAVLRPYVSDQNYWIVQHHGLFQGYYWMHFMGRDRNTRDEFQDHPWYRDCARFCARWDQASFDPAHPTASLATFEPLVRALFDRPPASYP
jgi:predicted HD phosphohydrolase